MVNQKDVDRSAVKTPSAANLRLSLPVTKNTPRSKTVCKTVSDMLKPDKQKMFVVKEIGVV